MLPFYLLLLASVVAGIVLVIALRKPHWFPWFLLPLGLIPTLLMAAGLGFLAMLAIYVFIPAVMGPFGLPVGCLLANSCGSLPDTLALAMMGLTPVWLLLLRWLWGRRPWIAYGLWLLGLFGTGWLLYAGLLPPD
jgi:hypothetical protein